MSEKQREVIKPNALKCGDCLELMPLIRKASVDLILCDLPYGVSRNKWDAVIPLDKMWKQYKRILTDKGSIVLTATQPFTSTLVCSNLEMFRYEWIWEKTIGSGQLNIKRQPLRVHESILVFGNGSGVYNEEKLPGKPYSIKRKAKFKGPGYGKQTQSEKTNTGYRHARSILKVPNPRITGGHPTQKPVELFRYLVRVFSNRGDVVLDNCMGSGTTGEAAILEGRSFIGMELNEKYFNHAVARLKGLSK